GEPLPDPTPQNKRIALYRDEIRVVARKRGATFLDLSDLFPLFRDSRWTDDGMHLNAYGYWDSSGYLLRGTGLGPPECALDLGANGKILSTKGMKAEKLSGATFRYRATSETLPLCLSPRDVPRVASHNVRRVLVKDLP